MTSITLAYSPDTDDAFMVYALREKLVPWSKYNFTFISEDIQKLNEKAQKSTFDITAISLALFPSIVDEYDLLPIGASIGDQFGPVVVTGENSALRSTADLAGKKIAVPGRQTSAFFAASHLLPSFTAVPMPFDQIQKAIHSGEVDAGILIHELQLNFEQFSLRKICDLGELWHNRFDLPLPLGGIVIRKSLPSADKKELLDLYRSSIEYAFKHRTDVLAVASEWALEGLDHKLSERYIDMYVNEDSLNLRPEVLQGMDQLFSCGYAAGICPKIKLNESMLLG